MAKFSVTAYFKTGFDGLNIPYNQTVLENAQKKEYSDVYFFREDLDNPYIKLKDTYDNLADVDYIKVVNHDTSRISFYFAKPHSEAKQTTGMELQLDALTTLGGAGALDYSSGWQIDGHISKTEDVLFAYTGDENISPVDPLIIANTKDLNPSGSDGDGLDIVISNTDLKTVSTWSEKDLIETIKGTSDASSTAEIEATMYIPKVPMSDASTLYKFYDPMDGQIYYYKIPNTAAWPLNDTVVRKALQTMFSIGIDGISNSYKIPAGYYGEIYREGQTYYNWLQGIKETLSSGMPFEFGSYKNKKVFSMYRKFVLYNIASGNIVSKDAEEIYKSGMTEPSIYLWSDPSPLGKPYARFTYQNSSNYAYDSACQGSQWCTNQIALEGASGSFWNNINLSNQSQSRGIDLYNYETKAINFGRQQLNNIVNAAETGAAIAGPMGAAMGIASVGFKFGAESLPGGEVWNQLRDANAFDAKQKIKKNEANAEFLQSQLQTPNTSFTPQPSLALYGMNKFVLQEIRPSDKSLKIFDNYFQRFGYSKINIPLTKECFNKRDYYCYVKAVNVSINSNFGMRIRQAAVSQLNDGVRVWKVLPDAKYYDLN